mmetsp:Transcript_30979/g.55657  ORF Transcript_30979/g.55657 Transcript_30979/m.55657 type:complete len:148 (-) Transcript_30979:181-624(-)
MDNDGKHITRLHTSTLRKIAPDRLKQDFDALPQMPLNRCHNVRVPEFGVEPLHASPTQVLSGSPESCPPGQRKEWRTPNPWQIPTKYDDSVHHGGHHDEARPSPLTMMCFVLEDRTAPPAGAVPCASGGRIPSQRDAALTAEGGSLQ